MAAATKTTTEPLQQ